MNTIAALYVLKDGPYFGLPGVDPWDESRDARTYPGPYPVVAHPPCARWGRYWSGGPSAHGTRELGADGGCFESALRAVCSFGGILEHPEASHAWWKFAIPRPPRSGGWIENICGGCEAREGWSAWTCCVDQGHYGHVSRKPTWLYAVGPYPPELIWGDSPSRVIPTDCIEAHRRQVRRGVVERLSARQRAATPIPFRDMLISYARSCRQRALEVVAC